MIQFNWKYFRAALLLFGSEVLIALFVHDAFVRPYVGDYLLVILLYCSLKSVVKLPVLTASAIVLLFSFMIELLQYLNFVAMVGLEENSLARSVLGTSYQWIDLVAYVSGLLTVLIAEQMISKKE